MTEEDSQSEKENLRVTSRVICCICSSTPKMFLRFMTPLMSSGAPDNLGGMSECQLSGKRKTTSVAEGSCRSRPPGQGGFDYQPPSQAYGRAGKCSQWFATSSHWMDFCTIGNRISDLHQYFFTIWRKLFPCSATPPMILMSYHRTPRSLFIEGSQWMSEEYC